MSIEADKTKDHSIQLLKIFAFSGWALAISSLFIGSYFLNKLHLEIVEMQMENKQLKLSLENAQTHHRLNAKPKSRSSNSSGGTNR